MLLKSEDVKRIDKYAVEKLNMPEIMLMENAGIGLVKNVRDDRDNILIVCGKGNNGGDGLVLARQLLSRGNEPEVFIFGSEDQLKGSVKVNYDILNKMNCRINFLKKEINLEYFKLTLDKSNLVVDAVFGIGLNREIEGMYKNVINIINNSEKEILAVDTPSGFNCSTGEIFKTCIKAKKTVTFTGEKFGFKNKEASKYTGEIVIEQISIPVKIVEKILENKHE